MTEAQWLVCDEPDLMLESVEGKVTRTQLVEFVRRCWARIQPPVESDVTVVQQFEVLAPTQSDHDAVLYAAEAALKAAGFAPSIRDEQRHQAAILRQIVDRP